MSNCSNIPQIPLAWNSSGTTSAVIFQNVGCNANGAPWGSYNAPTESKNNWQWNWMGLNSAVVQPNTTLTGCDQYGSCKTVGPGVYHSGLGLGVASSFSVKNIVPPQDWLANCCFGKYSPASECLNYRQGSQDCQVLLTKRCSDSKNFFADDCKTWLQSMDSSLKNQIANQVCPKASTQSEKDWCACFNIGDVPPEFASNPNIVALWPCLNKTCNSSAKALQPYQKNCPNTLTICNNADIVSSLTQSQVGSSTVQNLCGNINIPATTSTTSTTTTKTPAVAPAPSPTSILGSIGSIFGSAPSPTTTTTTSSPINITSSKWFYIIIGIVILLIIVFIIIIIGVSRRKSMSPAKK